MWDDPKDGHGPGALSHDLPCTSCGHAGHHFLPCDRNCGCEGAPMLATAGVLRAG